MPTQPLTLPNGKVVQIPAEWGPEQAQQWLDTQAPTIKQSWQRDFDKAVDHIPDAYGAGSLLKGLIKGTVDTVAHPIENLPTVGAAAGSLLAAPVTALTGGAAAPLAIGLPAAGAALGHVGRDLIRHQEHDPRASRSVGDEAMGAAGSALLEGALAAVPVAAKAVGKPLKGFARNQYVKTIAPSVDQMKRLAGSSWKGWGAAANEMADMGLNKGIKTTPEGLMRIQSIIEDIERKKVPVLNRATTTYTPATDLIDPAKNANLADLEKLFGGTLDPREANKIIKAIKKQISTSPNLTQGGRPKVLSATDLHNIISKTESTAKYTYGGMNDVKNETMKAVASGGRKMLADTVPGLKKLNRDERLLINLRAALQNTLSRGEVTSGNLPSLYLALSHPGIALASGAIKDPVASTWLRGEGAHVANRAAQRLMGVNIPKAQLIQQGLGAGMFGPNSEEEEQAKWNRLYEEWMAGKQ